MNQETCHPALPSDLRERAEAMVQDRVPNLEFLSPEEIQGIIHDSRVTAAVLKLENESLRKACEETRKSRDEMEEQVRRQTVDLERTIGNLQLALDAAHMGWWHYDPVTRISSWDDRYKEIFGVTGSSRPNEEILARLHPDDLPEVWAKVEAALDPVDPKPYSAEYRIFLPDGTMRWIEAHGIALFEGEGESRRAAAFVGTVADITESKQAETALRESEALLDAFFINNPEGMVIYSEDNRYVRINTFAADQYGMSVEEVLGKSIYDILPPVLAHATEQRNRMVLESKQPVSTGVYSAWLPGRSGKWETTWWQGVRFPVPLPGGKTGVGVVTLDITERVQAEAAVRESRDFLQSIIDNTPAPIYIKDLEGRILIANAALAKFLGHPREEIIGKTSFDFYPKEAADEHTVNDREILERGEPVSFEEIAPIDGVVRTFLSVKFPLKDESGKIYGIGGVSTEITERKRADAALRESEERLRLITENSPDISFFQDRDLRYTWVANPNAPTADKRVIGKTDAEIPGFVDAERIMNIKRDVLRSGETVRVEFRIIAEDGEHWFEDIYTPRWDDRGNIIGLFGYARDVTDRKRVEERARRLNEQLERQTAQLAATNRELESFSYSISHDLRAPLRSLDGFSLALEEDYGGALDEQGHDYINRIRAAAQRMARLIDDLLQLSRTTRAELKYTTVNLSDQAQSVLEELRAAEPDRKVETVIQPGIRVEGDEILLRQVLQNLLGNAWKFTSHREDARIEFGEKLEEGKRVFFVRDNGAGFDMKYAGNLFAPFRRLHSESEFSGTGIGLSIVKRIIDRHGGSVWAEGEPDGGATFFFTLGEQ